MLTNESPFLYGTVSTPIALGANPTQIESNPDDPISAETPSPNGREFQGQEGSNPMLPPSP